MNTFSKKAQLIYSLTCKYGSEYRTGNEVPMALQNAQIDFLLSHPQNCGIDDMGRIQCWILYVCGGEFNWTLSSHDNITTAVKVLYEEMYSDEALRIINLRIERSKKWSERNHYRRNRILNMQRIKRGEITSMPLRRR